MLSDQDLTFQIAHMKGGNYIETKILEILSRNPYLPKENRYSTIGSQKIINY